MKWFSLLCAVLLMVLVVSSGVAEVPSIDGLSLDDLVALKDQLNLAIWNSSDWEEVTVPQGIWEIGVDIPTGHWTIKAADGAFAMLEWCGALNETKTGMDWNEIIDTNNLVSETSPAYRKDQSRVQLDWELTDGTYLIISSGSVIFTPYEGKPAFTFKGQ